MKRFLVKHVGNMGDMIFFVPPILASLKKHHPNCHITFVTAWGFKERKRKWFVGEKHDVWGHRNQDGFCISLIKTNPNIDQLIHWHDTKTSLAGTICVEEGMHIPTWSKEYYTAQAASGKYDAVYELDIGIGMTDNPLSVLYKHVGLPQETYSFYDIHLTDKDKYIAGEAMKQYSKPRIVLLEGLEGKSTRGWDTDKVPLLEQAIRDEYGVDPIWFGGKYIHEFEGRPLTLRENIATLTYCDVAIGVMSGPMHFAAAVGLPTIALFADQPLHRAAPAYFLNPYILDTKKQHRTILGPTNKEMEFLKNNGPSKNLTPAEAKSQGAQSWENPGRQSTKTGLAAITVDEVMTVLRDMV